MDPLMSDEEVQKILKVSRQTLSNWCKNQGLPYIKMGTKLRFKPEEVRAWIATKSHKPEKQAR